MNLAAELKLIVINDLNFSSVNNLVDLSVKEGFEFVKKLSKIGKAASINLIDPASCC